MSPREYRRIFNSLSPIEREMLRDTANGTAYPHTKTRWHRKARPPTYWQARAEKRRIAELIEAADRHVAEERTKQTGYPQKCSQHEHNPTDTKIYSVKRARRVRVAA